VVDAGENDGAMDSIDCGLGVDRVIVNRRDLFFNCEHVTRVHGRRVPGIVRRGTEDGDNLSWYQWYDRDFIIGFGGDDFLNGHGNADMLWGNQGDDTLVGSHSPDHVLGGPGDDQLWGDATDGKGNGLDRLWGGAGLDTLYGGRGNDELISITADGVADVLDCGPGRDRAIVRTGDTVAGCERVIRISG
jgi:Ca2+-binding RTX toxin-like protein